MAGYAVLHVSKRVPFRTGVWSFRLTCNKEYDEKNYFGPGRITVLCIGSGR